MRVKGDAVRRRLKIPIRLFFGDLPDVGAVMVDEALFDTPVVGRLRGVVVASVPGRFIRGVGFAMERFKLGADDGLMGLMTSSGEGGASVRMNWGSLVDVKFQPDEVRSKPSTFLARLDMVKEGSTFSVSSIKSSDGECLRFIG